MGRWHDDNDGWGYYQPSRPRKVEGGIKARSERGAIGATWWSRRWVHVLESFSLGTRLTRGRSYARQGQVISIEIQPGMVKAKVQGSQPRPYRVTINLEPLHTEEWEQVTEAMAARAIFAAKLLAGEMPQDIEEAFTEARLSLFPTRVTDLATDCSCPDWANPCKHIAAVYYLLAERFDEDPFLIFKLRGRTKEQIIAALREKRTTAIYEEGTSPDSETEEVEQEQESLLLEAHLDTFWQAGEALDSFTVNPTAPGIEKALLKRLGEAPFTPGKQSLITLLARAYDAVERATQQKIDRS